MSFRAPGFNPNDEPWNAWGDEPDDPESCITDDLRCSNCGEQLDIELMHSYDYQVERSGVQPGTVHGPAVYWNEGTIACPGCGVRLDYQDSSD